MAKSEYVKILEQAKNRFIRINGRGGKERGLQGYAYQNIRRH